MRLKETNTFVMLQDVKTLIATLRSMFSRKKFMFWEMIGCFCMEFQAHRETTFSCLATAKLGAPQSCTKLSRVETWILCFPSEIKIFFPLKLQVV